MNEDIESILRLLPLFGVFRLVIYDGVFMREKRSRVLMLRNTLHFIRTYLIKEGINPVYRYVRIIGIAGAA